MAYVRMMVDGQAGVLGHVKGEATAFDLERRVYAAFGSGAELVILRNQATESFSLIGCFTAAFNSFLF